jgi:hypothetical protein
MEINVFLGKFGSDGRCQELRQKGGIVWHPGIRLTAAQAAGTAPAAVAATNDERGHALLVMMSGVHLLLLVGALPSFQSLI